MLAVSKRSDTKNISLHTPGPPGSPFPPSLSPPVLLTLPYNYTRDPELNKQAAVSFSTPDRMEDHDQSLTAAQIKKYSSAFRKFDTDKDGNINGKDLGEILRHIGHNPTEAEIQVRK